MTPPLPNPFADMFAAAPTPPQPHAAKAPPPPADFAGSIAELEALAGAMSTPALHRPRSLQEARMRFADQVADIVADLCREAIEAA